MENRAIKYRIESMSWVDSEGREYVEKIWKQKDNFHFLYDPGDKVLIDFLDPAISAGVVYRCIKTKNGVEYDIMQADSTIMRIEEGFLSPELDYSKMQPGEFRQVKK